MNTSSRADVTVVIPHYGDPANAVAVVSRLRRQRGVALEIVVVDDASPEAMPELDGVVVARRERNGGFGAAVNSGVALATAPLALILNSDLDIDDTFVADLLAAAQPWQPAVVAPALVSDTGETQWSGRRFPTTAQQCVEWLTPLARFRDRAWWHAGVGHDLAATPGETVAVDWLVGAALLLPTELFREAGGFDERFHMNSEEVDLQLRLARAGVPRVYAGAVQVRHEGGGSSASERRRQWVVTSRIRYARKWHGEGGATRLRAALALASLVNLTVNAVRQLSGTEIDAWRTFHDELAYLRRGAR